MAILYRGVSQSHREFKELTRFWSKCASLPIAPNAPITSVPRDRTPCNPLGPARSLAPLLATEFRSLSAGQSWLLHSPWLSRTHPSWPAHLASEVRRGRLPAPMADTWWCGGGTWHMLQGHGMPPQCWKPPLLPLPPPPPPRGAAVAADGDLSRP